MFTSDISKKRFISQFYIILRTDFVISNKQFINSIEKMTLEVNKSKSSKKNKKVLLPNQPEINIMKHRLKNGIPIESSLVKEINNLINENNLSIRKHLILPEVSIIIRTKNEERWINECLNSIFSQSFKDFEIIIVDNNSNDKTIEKAKKFDIKHIINLEEYFPGKALNKGISQSLGEFIVAISAHCIPTNSHWLENLVKAIKEDSNYAGVYGRQQPMSFSSDTDKRDLTLVFGLDRKIQLKDNFFHNANSIIRKKCWDLENYDNNITNIEDRLWAQSMLKKISRYFMNHLHLYSITTVLIKRVILSDYIML